MTVIKLLSQRKAAFSVEMMKYLDLKVLPVKLNRTPSLAGSIDKPGRWSVSQRYVSFGEEMEGVETQWAKYFPDAGCLALKIY